MKRHLLLLPIVLSACSKTIPFYTYENTHVLDEKLAQKNVCLIIDNKKTQYKKGTKELDSDPFLGNEGFSSSAVDKTTRDYDYAFVNDSCKSPIKLTRKIEVSGIFYPGTCSEKVYAGSVYTGSSTYSSGRASATLIGNNILGSYSGTTDTYIDSIPIYNTRRYPCIKEQYLTQIEFYHDSKYVGKIRNKYWSTSDTDETIDVFTEEFLRILSTPKKE